MPKATVIPYPTQPDGGDGRGVSTAQTLVPRLKDPTQSQFAIYGAQREVIEDQKANGSWSASYKRHQAELLRKDGLPVSEKLADLYLRELANASLLNGIVREHPACISLEVRG